MSIRIPRDDLPANPGGLLRPALTLFVVLSIVTGLLYPLAVTGVAQTAPRLNQLQGQMGQSR